MKKKISYRKKTNNWTLRIFNIENFKIWKYYSFYIYSFDSDRYRLGLADTQKEKLFPLISEFGCQVTEKCWANPDENQDWFETDADFPGLTEILMHIVMKKKTIFDLLFHPNFSHSSIYTEAKKKNSSSRLHTYLTKNVFFTLCTWDTNFIAEG